MSLATARSAILAWTHCEPRGALSYFGLFQPGLDHRATESATSEALPSGRHFRTKPGMIRTGSITDDLLVDGAK
jgi:hypothetical protein